MATNFHADLLDFFRTTSKDDIDVISNYMEQKYMNHEFFAQLGKDFLLFMNPATPNEEPSFSKDQLDLYLPISNEKTEQEPHQRPMPPHLFQLAAKVYANMLFSGQDQTIFFMYIMITPLD